MDARSHLPVIKNAYRAQVVSLEKYLITEASKPVIVTAITTSKSTSQTSKELENARELYHLASVSIISVGDTDGVGKVQIEDGDINPSSNLYLISHAQGSESVSTLQMGYLKVAAPIKNKSGMKIGVLLAMLSINDEFAFNLSKFASDQPGYSGLNIALCAGDNRKQY
jgi:hypothetical protein